MFFLLSVQTIFGSHQLTYDRPKRWLRQTEQLQLTFSEVIVFLCFISKTRLVAVSSRPATDP